MSLIITYVKGCSLKYSLPVVFNGRWFSRSTYHPSKQAIQRRWQRMTERYLKKTANMLSSSENNTQKKKKTHLTHTIPIYNLPMSSAAGTMPNAGCQRRAYQLSVVFYDYITSLLSIGEVCPDLNEFCFEVVSVKVLPDMSAINVSWAATGEPADDIITALLPRCASELRSKLIDLRIMGNLPPIQFIKDFTASRLRQVEELLRKADMGPDYEPASLGDSLKMEPSLLTENLRHNDMKPDRLEGYSYKLGPGGSLEIAVTARDELHGSVIGAEVCNSNNDGFKHEKTINTNSETAGEEKFAKIRKVEALSSTTTSRVENVGGALSFKSVSRMPSNSFRSDVYGLDHNVLYQQVLQTKRRAEDRTYARQTSEAVNKSRGLLDVNFIRKEQVGNMLTNKQNNAKRPNREINRLLSSQFHLNSDS